MKPREKMNTYGPAKLEGRELVATILGSGSRGADIFSIAKKADKLIKKKGLAITKEDLQNIKGIGTLKAMQLISGFELAKRYLSHEDVVIQSTYDVLQQVQERRTKKQEHLICLSLDGANRLIQKEIVTIGLLNQSLVHPREVFAPAIQYRANSIILVHNHPSDMCHPSSQDRAMTGKIKEVGELIGIKLQDHVIITKDNYWSFKEEGEL